MLELRSLLVKLRLEVLRRRSGRDRQRASGRRDSHDGDHRQAAFGAASTVCSAHPFLVGLRG
ncbi:MAG: hypothetical protein AUG48_07095 [Actinobacteria bacterium 13_1_20CM_3_68_9]|nr:MAG: hypothetical protein AUG48_07095 [Actinobacteria bacterium 13_1_20CM_3_68_9]